MKFDKDLLDKFLSGKYAMALRTQEEWNQFMELLENETKVNWGNIRKPTYHDFWSYNGIETAVRIHSELNELSYCDVDWYSGRGYQIIEFSDLIKLDLRDLLQVGYKIYCECGDITLLDLESCNLYKKACDDSLMINNHNIVSIYRPKYNGIKPMEWVLIWEREEELFTLELPNNTKLERYFGISLDDETKYGFYKLKCANRKSNHLKLFTQQEIDNLPNQELIKSLVKKEVKGE